MDGVELKVRRIRLGMTQAQFAQMIGTSQVLISRWENGARMPRWVEYYFENQDLKANLAALTDANEDNTSDKEN